MRVPVDLIKASQCAAFALLSVFVLCPTVQQHCAHTTTHCVALVFAGLRCAVVGRSLSCFCSIEGRTPAALMEQQVICCDGR